MMRLVCALVVSGFCLTGFAADNKVNLLVAPIGAALDTTRVGADFVVAENMTMGIRYTRADTDYEDFSANGESFGIAARFFITSDAMDGGLYLSPEISFPSIELEAEVDGDRGTADLNDPIYTATLGYQWMWDHFNINLGAGVGYVTSPDEIRIARAGGGTEVVEVPEILPSGELSLGWAF